MKNKLLINIFYFNEFINLKIEKLFIRLTNQSQTSRCYITNTRKNKLRNTLIKCFIYQKSFTNPNFCQVTNILKKLYRMNRLKLIHSSPLYLTANFYAFRFANKNNIPYICTPLFHINPYLKELFGPSFHYILKKADAIIALTKIEKIFYCKYGISKKKIHVIPPGIDPNDYLNQGENKLRKKYEIPEDCPIILFVGRKTYYKGIYTVIHSLNYLIKKFKDIRLVLIGSDSREYWEFFRKLPKKLTSKIIDLGVVNTKTISNAYAICDVLVLPSLEDAYGIVYLEAWLFKKPVIGASEGNVSGVIDENFNGFLIPFNNIKKLSSKVEKLLRDRILREFLGQNGYNKIMQQNLFSKTGKSVLELYEKFI